MGPRLEIASGQWAVKWYKAVGYIRLDTLRSELMLELKANLGTPPAGRLLFVTEKGRIGLGSFRVKKGDTVSCVAGAPVPFVLRKVSSEEEEDGLAFKLMGECYVHGIMDGEW